MAKYIFTGIFTPEESGGYSVRFPDVEGVYTCGKSLEEAYAMAEDALTLMLLDSEERGAEIPQPTHINKIKERNDEIKSLVRADTTAYKIKLGNETVKKTLSIPSWLNEEAKKAGLNFSQELQERLKERLGAG